MGFTEVKFHPQKVESKPPPLITGDLTGPTFWVSVCFFGGSGWGLVIFRIPKHLVNIISLSFLLLFLKGFLLGRPG